MRRSLLLLLLTVVLMATALSASAAPIMWIWSPQHQPGKAPQTACYFRKAIQLSENPERVQVAVAADDSFELFINGRRVSGGEHVGRLVDHNVTSLLSRGRNVVAVKVVNTRGSTAGLAARVTIKLPNDKTLTYSSNNTWVTNLKPLPLWNSLVYNDSRWNQSRVVGPFEKPASKPAAEPAAKSVAKSGEQQPAKLVETPVSDIDYGLPPDFVLDRIVPDENVGSLASMTFNEFGQLIAAQEAGPLLLLSDGNDDGALDQVGVYCDKVSNCQGLLALNGELFVTGDGPDGTALYRLSDTDLDGILDEVRALVKFNGVMGLHGPHGLTLGADGLIYMVVGPLADPNVEYDALSPHHGYYEGDVPSSRVEDPTGREALAKVPGGAIIRTDIEGRAVQLLAGGLRNAYDLAFNRTGDLFVHDSGNEADRGLPWHRPGRLYHAVAGAEFGWRSGWAKLPEYYFDVLPPVLTTDAESPSGLAFYMHYAFPAKYHTSLFLADRERGEITHVQLRSDGAGYAAERETFLEKSPLKIMDLEAGPDGGLYFVTGGRDADGGIYRIAYKGDSPASSADLGEGIGAAIRQPQLHSAWSRQALAAVQQEMDDTWGPMMIGVATSGENPWHYRTRSLDLLQLFGPLPTTKQLVAMSQVDEPHLQAKAADLLGINAGDMSHAALIALLESEDALVRRKACEALARSNQPAPLETLRPLLLSEDRSEAWAARRLLERLDTDQWCEDVLASDNHQLFIRGALAWLIVDGSRENADRVLERFAELLPGYISDDDFVDMLRLVQIAIRCGDILPEELSELASQLADEFPAGHEIMNRELVRLLAEMRVSSIGDRYMEQLESNASDEEKTHLGMLLAFVSGDWTREQRFATLGFFEDVMRKHESLNYAPYIVRAVRNFTAEMSGEEIQLVLAQGDERPGVALAVLYHLPQQLDETTVERLQELDDQLIGRTDRAAQRLQVGIVAVLARSGDAASFEHLRNAWDRTPERRQTLALGLAQHPGGENWGYLVRTLPILKGDAAREVITRLRTVENVAADAEQIRELILLALRLSDHDAMEAVALLEHWTGEEMGLQDASADESLQAWQEWFNDAYPDRPPAKLADAAAETKERVDAISSFLATHEGTSGSPVRGGEVFASAKCSLCHRIGDTGEPLGPNLTGIGLKRTELEVLQSIVFPSLRMSGNYLTQTVTTNEGKKLTGLATKDADGEVIVLLANGTKVSLKDSELKDVESERQSTMPSGLLDELNMEQIADLFAFLREGANSSELSSAEPTPAEKTYRVADEPSPEPAERK